MVCTRRDAYRTLSTGTRMCLRMSTLVAGCRRLLQLSHRLPPQFLQNIVASAPVPVASPTHLATHGENEGAPNHHTLARR